MPTMVNDRSEQLKLRHAAYMVFSFVLLLWVVKAIEWASGVSFSSFGILPRTLKGTIGIITGPLIHGDIFHLISNTLPLVVLGFLLFYFYHRIAVEVSIWIYLVTGFWTWMLARNAYHIGASGIVYALASFLFFGGIIRKNKQLMTVSGIIIVLYGGMMHGVFPGMVDANVSWESHLLGALAGILLAILFRKTKIGSDQERGEDDLPEENQDESYFNHTGVSDSHEFHYTFKPKDKGE